MPIRAPRRAPRRSAAVAGRREAQAIAATLGGTVRSARRARGWTLDRLATAVGTSRSRLSQIERGEGIGAPLATWIALGLALDRPLAVGYSRSLDEPRGPVDVGHLRIQEHILGLARATGRTGTFELPTRPIDPSRSTDIGIVDPHHAVRILTECWNTFGDVGAAIRATHRKQAEAPATWPDDRIAAVWVVGRSEANRRLIDAHPNIIDAAFPGSSRAWVAALGLGADPPREPGLVWFDGATGRLREHRRATMRR